jgi:hypothetical protein
LTRPEPVRVDGRVSAREHAPLLSQQWWLMERCDHEL